MMKISAPWQFRRRVRNSTPSCKSVNAVTGSKVAFWSIDLLFRFAFAFAFAYSMTQHGRMT